MEIGEAVGRYEQAAALLPSRWQQAARRVPEHRKAQAEEFRLRAGRPMTLLTCEGELLVSDELPRQSVTQADLEQLCDAVTGYSRYAAAETMGKGYLIGRGGFRIGLCGTVAVRGDGGTALRDISSAVVRISRQVRGLWQEVPEWSAGGFDSTLIAAPPGGGKTTLLRCIAGLEMPDSGTVTGVPERLGFVFQEDRLCPQLDAVENVRLVTGRAMSRPDIEAHLRELGLADCLHQRAAELSGGQRRRVSIARALAKNPKLLLCDEPTGALDYKTGKQVLGLLQETCRKTGRTVIVITHNTALTGMADRIIQVRSGRIVSNQVNEHPVPVEQIEW